MLIPSRYSNVLDKTIPYFAPTDTSSQNSRQWIFENPNYIINIRNQRYQLA